MKNKLICLILAVLMLISIMPWATFAASFKIVMSPQKLSVNGINVDCEKYNIDGSNYFKLRDLAEALNGTDSQFEVGYDNDAKLISITTGKAYTAVGGELSLRGDYSSTATPSAQSIMIDGQPVSGLSVYNIGGNNFFKLRDLGSKLGFNVGFDSVNNCALVKSYSKEEIVKEDPAGWDFFYKYSVDGVLAETNVLDSAPGPHTVTIYQDGVAFSEYTIKDGLPSNVTVVKNDDGTFTYDYKGGDLVPIKFITDKGNGFSCTIPSTNKPKGLSLLWHKQYILPGKGFGNNMLNQFVVEVCYDGNPISGYEVIADDSCAVKIQADNSLLIDLLNGKQGTFTVMYNGYQGSFNAKR